MIQPFEVKDTAGRVYRVNAESGEAAMRHVAEHRGVTVIAWRESKAPQDAIRIGMAPGSDA